MAVAKVKTNIKSRAFSHDYPVWVRWLAQDADGCWWGFEIEPLQYHRGWYENEVGRCIKLSDTAPNPQWRQSLFRCK